MKKIRPIVCGRRNVIFVAPQESVAVWTHQGHGALEHIGGLLHVIPVGECGWHARVIGHIERARLTERPESGNVWRRELPMFDQQRDRLPPMDEGDLPLWMRHAGALQGGEGRGEELETVARRQLEPAAHGQQSPWAQVPQVYLECLHRIKKTLVEGVDTGCRGTEGVQQGDLYQIIVIPTGRHEAAGFADMQTYIRGAVEMAGKIGVYPL